MDDYLAINRANWDARVPVHLANGYGTHELVADPTALSGVVRFDLPLLGDIDGLDAVHLQCHLGTDTLSLARLGARVTGLDLSGDAIAAAQDLAARAGTDVEYVVSDVYDAVEVLGPARFDLVYTGIGALCWLPSIDRWAKTVAGLLRPGGRLFVRDAHPVLLASLGMVVGAEHPDRSQQSWISGPGTATPALELSYFEQPEPLEWNDTFTYTGGEPVAAPLSVEWNHGLGEIVTAVLGAGMEITGLHEHDSVPWESLAGLMTYDQETGEWRLSDRPERLPASFTLTARLTPRG
ncbi:class I SAM-dependent methyltransferase [Cellulomonas dongxiuzhuiae]|uniref:Methyltransferase domain-containing protein n=1 Tax=Cellulomonas dongxiuzhuiae TaxID=2819979 RepID=A0ABX8GGG3_9CELL|nr:methyltransferase [Cellulomonas dongxiuzhuiae]MBO3093824.1 methyltransferase domain-containing protein [Cellulomonas dongxiuzhuiae]QWC14923.1 methyltransferase domain-containing protein [Cellulomonas dongxiuzhuiae]